MYSKTKHINYIKYVQNFLKIFENYLIGLKFVICKLNCSSVYASFSNHHLPYLKKQLVLRLTQFWDLYISIDLKSISPRLCLCHVFYRMVKTDGLFVTGNKEHVWKH